MSNINVLYIDLGAHKGEEIDLFLKKKTDDINLTIMGVEANPPLARQLKQKYKNNKNISIHNFCIARESGTIKLHEYQDTASSSIYHKTNVPSKNTYVTVEAKKLSDFIDSIDNFNEYDIKILKANIEGAEYDFVLDLHENNKFVFDIYLGSGAYPYSFLKDMSKAPYLVDKIKEAQEILDEHGVVAYRYIPPKYGEDPRRPKYQNVDLVKLVKETYSRK